MKNLESQSFSGIYVGSEWGLSVAPLHGKIELILMNIRRNLAESDGHSVDSGGLLGRIISIPVGPFRYGGINNQAHIAVEYVCKFQTSEHRHPSLSGGCSGRWRIPMDEPPTSGGIRWIFAGFWRTAPPLAVRVYYCTPLRLNTANPDNAL